MVIDMTTATATLPTEVNGVPVVGSERVESPLTAGKAVLPPGRERVFFTRIFRLRLADGSAVYTTTDDPSFIADSEAKVRAHIAKPRSVKPKPVDSDALAEVTAITERLRGLERSNAALKRANERLREDRRVARAEAAEANAKLAALGRALRGLKG